MMMKVICNAGASIRFGFVAFPRPFPSLLFYCYWSSSSIHAVQYYASLLVVAYLDPQIFNLFPSLPLPLWRRLVSLFVPLLAYSAACLMLISRHRCHRHSYTY